MLSLVYELPNDFSPGRWKGKENSSITFEGNDDACVLQDASKLQHVPTKKVGKHKRGAKATDPPS
jgi:hypothetical protein